MHSVNTALAKEVTESGIVISVREVQALNADSAIVVTLECKSILVKLLQYANESSGIVVSVSGILISSRLRQELKAFSPIEVRPLGKVTFLRFMQLVLRRVAISLKR